ncbi:HPr kinase/phosphorylase [Parelusimicrobium proximum]|uniref:HPr(Ser) kinase/phosphatase n=1 Tax=Parelusimicrobium proximum TaxID=3228953 RepID=UPI003D1762A3
MSGNEEKTNFVKSITVEELYKAMGEELELKIVCGEEHLGREISSSSINRPGLALCGYVDNFRANVVQIMGRGEYGYCEKLPEDELKENLDKMLSAGAIPCIIVTTATEIMPAIVEACEKADVPLIMSALDTSTIAGEIGAYLEDAVSPTTHVHGVMVDVSGLGILITGEPGIGKSECALELIKRGHLFVADDIVEVQKRRGNILMGSCPAMLKSYLEVRGLGILDIEMLFGVGAMIASAKIDMIVDLKSPTDMSIDRLGMDNHKTKILGVEVPMLSIPVTPGRNLAVLIEVASLNQQLKNQGVFSAEEFGKRVLDKMKENAGNKNAETK